MILCYRGVNGEAQSSGVVPGMGIPQPRFTLSPASQETMAGDQGTSVAPCW